MLENVVGASNQLLLEQGAVIGLFGFSLLGFLQINAFGNVWRKFYEKKAELEARARSGNVAGHDGFYEKGKRKVREPNSNQLQSDNWQAAISDYKERLRIALDELDKPDQNFRMTIVLGFISFVAAGLAFSSAALFFAIYFDSARTDNFVGWPQVAENFNRNFLRVFRGLNNSFELETAPAAIKFLNWYHAKMCALLWPSSIAFVFQIFTVPKLIVGRAADYRGHLELSDEKLREELLRRRGLSAGLSAAFGTLARAFGREFGSRRTIYGTD